MKRLEEFKTMEELLHYKKELETAISDDDILEEVMDKVFEELLIVNSFLNDIYNEKKTNRKWFAVLLTVLNSRSIKEQYKIQIISDIKSSKKIYTIDNSLHEARVEEHIINKDFNTVLFTKNAIDNCSGKSIKNNDIIYDSFEGKFDMSSYLEKEVDFSKVIDILENNGFSEQEIKVMNKFVFDTYKKEHIKNVYTKVRK